MRRIGKATSGWAGLSGRFKAVRIVFITVHQPLFLWEIQGRTGIPPASISDCSYTRHSP